MLPIQFVQCCRSVGRTAPQVGLVKKLAYVRHIKDKFKDAQANAIVEALTTVYLLGEQVASLAR